MKTKFYSEKLDKLFDTEAECKDAEVEYEKKVKAENAKKEERAADAKLVDEAFKEAIKAQDHYIELRNEFVKKYGSYHKTWSSTTPSMTSLVDLLFDSFI